MTLLRSFDYVANSDARVLILGSMPGVASLTAHQYYANPRNHFWPILFRLLNVNIELDYQQRLQLLRQHKIALWDVLAECQRRGSLDTNIKIDSVRCNNFAEFFLRHPHVCCIVFNGNAAAQLFHRFVIKTLSPSAQAINTVTLPSTSPAHASLRFDDKMAAWKQLLMFIEDEAPIVATERTR